MQKRDIIAILYVLLTIVGNYLIIAHALDLSPISIMGVEIIQFDANEIKEKFRFGYNFVGAIYTTTHIFYLRKYEISSVAIASLMVILNVMALNMFYGIENIFA